MTNTEIDELRADLAQISEMHLHQPNVICAAIWTLAETLDKVLEHLKAQNGCEHVFEPYSPNPGYTPAYPRCVKCGATL